MSSDLSTTTSGAWDDVRDAAFFGLTARLFGPGFCLGATVLLASYDDEDARPEPVLPVTAPVERRSSVVPQLARDRAA